MTFIEQVAGTLYIPCVAKFPIIEMQYPEPWVTTYGSSSKVLKDLV